MKRQHPNQVQKKKRRKISFGGFPGEKRGAFLIKAPFCAVIPAKAGIQSKQKGKRFLAFFFNRVLRKSVLDFLNLFGSGKAFAKQRFFRGFFTPASGKIHPWILQGVYQRPVKKHWIPAFAGMTPGEGRCQATILKILLSPLLLTLCLLVARPAHAQQETLPVHRQQGEYLLQAITTLDHAQATLDWLATLTPPALPPASQWPQGVTALRLYKKKTPVPGQVRRFRLRQAQLLGWLPVVEGLTLEQAQTVLAAAGFDVAQNPDTPAPVGLKPQIWLAGTGPQDEVRLWTAK